MFPMLVRCEYDYARIKCYDKFYDKPVVVNRKGCLLCFRFFNHKLPYITKWISAYKGSRVCLRFHRQRKNYFAEILISVDFGSL